MDRSLHRIDQEAVATKVVRKGHRLTGIDVFRDGTESCLRQQLMECESPEHAAIIGEILSNPMYLIFLASGRFNQQKIDEMAAALRTRRIPGSVSTTPEGTEHWEYAPIVSEADPSET